MMIDLRLTRSQQMALIDILIGYMRERELPQEFINVSEDVTTTPGELLSLVAGMPMPRS